jgi:uncharacterized repeat protein (TIGR04138 family)
MTLRSSSPVCEGKTTRSSLCAKCGESLTKDAVAPHELVALLQGGDLPDRFSEVAAYDGRYSKDAFFFVRDGLHQAVIALSRSSRHVTAEELLDALRSLAIERFGSSALEQLRSWGVTRCEDFGEIVFTLIKHGVFRKKPEDKKEDFSGGYDLRGRFQSRHRRFNQAMERTPKRLASRLADRCVHHLEMISTFPRSLPAAAGSTRVLVGGGMGVALAILS